MTSLEQEQVDQEQKLAELQKDQKMLKEEVDEEDFAQVVAKWTGIPVSFFFSSRRRHPSLTCDWSSDVCSSDLWRRPAPRRPAPPRCGPWRPTPATSSSS